MSAKPLIHQDFLLRTPQARTLYHEYAAGLPIIDYHCHLPPADVAGDRRWENITRIWLAGDHYKWRAMRWNGVPERYCTGNASDWEKFLKWAETVPRALRNPLYHWTHLELARYFGIDDRLLSAATAREVWDECNARVAEPEFSARQLMRQSRVVVVCTTDDPTDTLEHHRAVSADTSFDVQMLPTWRPDRGMAVEQPAAFNAWVDKLGAAADVDIRDFAAYLDALRNRHDAFAAHGCLLSDHGLETVYAESYTEDEVVRIFQKIRGGAALTADEQITFKSAMLYEFAVMDAAGNWTQQFHLGALRNNSPRMFAAKGPDVGFDSIGDFEIARPLSRLFGRLDAEGRLARTIVYNLNPRDNALLATMCGNFQDGSVAGKMQFGSGWWFLDQKDGIERHIEDLSMMGLLSRFVGMLTDSRSFLSYPRHEYFRRVLCNILGRDMADGLVPDDVQMVGELIQDVCYRNAASYFGFDLQDEGRP